MKKEIFYNEEAHDSLVNQIIETGDILKAALAELKQQGLKDAKDLTLQSLQYGQFVKAFDDFHVARQKESPLTREMLFSRFLELYGYHSKDLEALQEKYLSSLNQEHLFYEINHSFYSRAASLWRHYPQLKHFADNLPKSKVYKLFDFMAVKGNDIKVNVPKELFILHATNERQLLAIENVTNFVKLGKALGVDKEVLEKQLSSFLIDKYSSQYGNRSWGISLDFETISFDYNKILAIE